MLDRSQVLGAGALAPGALATAGRAIRSATVVLVGYRRGADQIEQYGSLFTRPVIGPMVLAVGSSCLIRRHRGPRPTRSRQAVFSRVGRRHAIKAGPHIYGRPHW